MSAKTKHAEAAGLRRKAKLPREFELIGQTKNAVLRVGASAATPRHPRQFGNRSPLDRLPHKVKSELRKRCKTGDVFREIRDWLLTVHQCATSIQSLSVWWRRQQELAANSGNLAARNLHREPLEFIVHAPGASEIRVLVKSR